MKFTGIAYWEVKSKDSHWLEQACLLLQPLENSGMAVVQFNDQTKCMNTIFGHEHHIMQFSDDMGYKDLLGRTVIPQGEKLMLLGCRGVGVVRDCSTAPMFIVCLMAMRRHLGDMRLVNDAQKSVAMIPRVIDPLFASSWDRVLPVAQALGLSASASQMESISPIRMF
jgi:hypothetical protein